MHAGLQVGRWGRLLIDRYRVSAVECAVMDSVRSGIGFSLHLRSLTVLSVTLSAVTGILGAPRAPKLRHRSAKPWRNSVTRKRPAIIAATALIAACAGVPVL